MIKEIIKSFPNNIQKRIITTSKEFLYVDNTAHYQSFFTFTNDNNGKYIRELDKEPCNYMFYIEELREVLKWIGQQD